MWVGCDFKRHTPNCRRQSQNCENYWELNPQAPHLGSNCRPPVEAGHPCQHGNERTCILSVYNLRDIIETLPCGHTTGVQRSACEALTREKHTIEDHMTERRPYPHERIKTVALALSKYAYGEYADVLAILRQIQGEGGENWTSPVDNLIRPLKARIEHYLHRPRQSPLSDFIETAKTNKTLTGLIVERNHEGRNRYNEGYREGYRRGSQPAQKQV